MLLCSGLGACASGGGEVAPAPATDPKQAAASGCPTPPARIVRLTETRMRNGQAAWSPDGSEIAFVSNRSGSWQVWVMGAGGGEARRVTDSPEAVGWPSWSPSGDRILYYAGSGNQYRMWSIPTAGGPPEPVLDSQFSDFRPSLSPDGRRLLFDRFGATEPRNHDLHVADLTTGEVTVLAADPGYDSDARWSPDGRQVVFHSDRDGNRQYDLEVYLVGADGRGLRALTYGPDRHSYPVWCPNGAWIAHVKERNGRRDIWMSAIAGVVSCPLITLPGRDDNPIWSPDGTRLVFVTDHFGEGEELAWVDTPWCAAAGSE